MLELYGSKPEVAKPLNLFGLKALVDEILELFISHFSVVQILLLITMHASLTVKFYPGKFSFALEDQRILHLL